MTEAQKIREARRALFALTKAVDRLYKYERDFQRGKEWVGNALGGEKVLARAWDAIVEAQRRAKRVLRPTRCRRPPARIA